MRTDIRFPSHPTVLRIGFVAEPIGDLGVILVVLRGKRGRILAFQGQPERRYHAWVNSALRGEAVNTGHFYAPLAGATVLKSWPRTETSLFKDLAVPPDTLGTAFLNAEPSQGCTASSERHESNDVINDFRF